MIQISLLERQAQTLLTLLSLEVWNSLPNSLSTSMELNPLLTPYVSYSLPHIENKIQFQWPMIPREPFEGLKDILIDESAWQERKSIQL